MSKIIHTILAHLFYHIGDIICHLPWEWTYRLYQYSMKKSIEHDEQIGYKIWKEPT